MSALGENEFKREAVRVLRKLDAGATLRPLADGRFALAKRAKRIGDARLCAGAELTREMRARGLVQPCAEGYGISPAGRDYLVRSQAVVEPFAAQHRMLETRIIERQGGKVHVAVNLAESPLAMLRRRNLVDADAFDAGERLRRDYTLAQLTPRMGVDWSAPCAFGRRAAKPDYLPDTVLAAKQRFRAAMAAAGADLSGLLFDVCCELIGMEECEKRRGWPRASAKVVLKIALSKLARHYGIGDCIERAPTRVWVREADPPP
jgi:hypothetical protein